MNGNILHARWGTHLGDEHGLDQGFVTQVLMIESEPECHIWEATVHKMKSFLKVFQLPHSVSSNLTNGIRLSRRLGAYESAKLDRIYEFITSQLADPRKHGSSGTYSFPQVFGLDRDMLRAFEDDMTQPDIVSPEHKEILTAVGLLFSQFSLIEWSFHGLIHGCSSTKRSFRLALAPHNAKVNDLLLPLAPSKLLRNTLTPAIQ